MLQVEARLEDLEVVDTQAEAPAIAATTQPQRQALALRLRLRELLPSYKPGYWAKAGKVRL